MDFSAIAPYLTHPLVLAGFVLMLFFSIHRTLIKSGVIPPLNKKDGASVVHALLKYGVFIAALIIITGFALQYVRHQSDMEKLVNKYGITEGALNSFFATLKEKKVPPEEYPEALQKFAERFLSLQKQLADLKNEGSAHAKLLAQAEQAINAGDYTRAEDLIKKYFDAESRDAKKKWEQSQLNLAKAPELLGESAMVQLQHQKAASHFEQAVQLVPEGNGDQKAKYQLKWANALREFGDYKGDNAALEQAIGLYREVLDQYTLMRAPSKWTTTKNELGTALWRLGLRELGTARLEEAVATFRSVLRVNVNAEKEERLDWAMTQHKLGKALCGLAKREEGTERWKEAVVAFESAQTVITEREHQKEWAKIQHNLAIALLELSDLEPDKYRFEDAKKVLQSALNAIKEDRFYWAVIQNTLSSALLAEGIELNRGSEKDEVLIKKIKGLAEQAEQAFGLVLEVHTREMFPLDWATAQNNLGTALLLQAGMPGVGKEKLKKAVKSFESALEVRTREKVPLDRADSLERLGLALWFMGTRESLASAKLDYFEKALNRMNEAKSINNSSVIDQNIKYIQTSIDALSSGVAVAQAGSEE